MRLLFHGLTCSTLIFVLTACGNANLTDDTTNLDYGLVESTQLSNGELVSNLSGAKNSQKFYKITVPSGASNLKFTLSGGTGNSDIYVKFGAKPTTTNYNCRPFKTDNNEVCVFSTPRAGTYHVLLRGRTSYSKVQLLSQYRIPTPNGKFAVTFIFGSNVTASQKQLFRNAAARWQKVITGDISNTTLNKPRDACLDEPAYNGAVDDVVIYAEVGPIDGPGGILGGAGPCIVRANYLPVYGAMIFDSADVNSFDLSTVILHEMGHVFGIGSLWAYLDLVNYEPLSCSSAPKYLGTFALQEWRALGKNGNIPVENSGGQGTACGHWDEETFDNELMTGYIERSGAMPLSRMTVGSLQDIGYTVNKAAADSYRLPACSPSCLKIFRQQPVGKEFLIEPVGMISPVGRIHRLKPAE